MPERGSTACSSELSQLSEDIRALLLRSDALGLPYVAIHLCNALETLESVPALGELPIARGGEGSKGGLPG